MNDPLGARFATSESPARLEHAAPALAIYTLGRFSLLRHGSTVHFTRKSPNKPLELLKALIAFGGLDVRKHKLAEALWPDADADLASYSLTAALHRLRAIVGRESIELRGGCLSLCPDHCWVDVWSFERQVAALEDAHRALDLKEMARITSGLARQYCAEFLAGNDDHPWVLSTRERLRARFVRALAAVGAAHARADDYDVALTCMQKAVEIDPLAEGPYRDLMQLHLDRGRHADVLLTYQRCRRILATELACAPSVETEALLRRARAQ